VCFGADQSFVDQFLGNPLLILVVALGVDVIVILYHRIRK
jgi:hypothetical protein